MNSEHKPVNIARLLMTFNFEIKALPDYLKCTKCKSVLKDACQVSCGCRFCRICINDLVVTGSQFCPGDSHECGRTPLSTVQCDYGANRNILKVTAKCPHAGCSYNCPLADMENHMYKCLRKNIDCPFRELGCLDGNLAAEDMSSHMQLENQSHSQILIGMIADIKRNVEMLEDQQIIHMENEIKLIKDENKSIKEENKSIKEEIKLIKDENKSIKDENKFIKDVNKSIQMEKEVLSDHVWQLSEKLDREIDKKIQSDSLYSARISTVTGEVASNRDALGSEIKSLRDDIQLIKYQFDTMKYYMKSIQVTLRLAQLNDWSINENLCKVEWWQTGMTSNKFMGEGRPHTYELVSFNSVSISELWIWLRIWASPSDALLQWPFRGTVTVTITHMDRRETSYTQTRQCRIERPPDNDFSISERFQFSHVALLKAGLDLKRGVRVSCQIVPGPNQ